MNDATPVPTVDAFGTVCWVRNNDGASILLPPNSATEWARFRQYAPNVTLRPACRPGPLEVCSGGQSVGYRVDGSLLTASAGPAAPGSSITIAGTSRRMAALPKKGAGERIGSGPGGHGHCRITEAGRADQRRYLPPTPSGC